MSTITFTCYACNQVLKVGQDKAGKKAKCIKCGTILTIPMATPEEPEEAVAPEPEPAPAAKRRPRDDDDYDDEPRPKKRRDDDDYDDEPRARKRRDDDDYDDEPRGRRGRDHEDDEDSSRSKRAGAGGSIFARKGLNTTSMIFLFAGVGLMLLFVIFVFLPWKKLAVSGGDAKTAEMARQGLEKLHLLFPGLASTSSGIKEWQGIIGMILSILGIAFVMVALFVLDHFLFKLSLWSGFGVGLTSGILALLSAIISTGAPGPWDMDRDPQAPKIVWGGNWAAWVAMVLAILAGVMFLLTVFMLQPVAGSKPARSARDDYDDDLDDAPPPRKRGRDDDYDDEEVEESRPRRRGRDDDD